MTTRRQKPARGFAATAQKTSKRFAVAACLALVALLSAGASAAAQSAAQGELLSEVRVHGNYATPDAEVLRLAGISPGQVAGPSIENDVRARLRQSGRFVNVEVRKRYRSLDATSGVALIIIVQEYPVPEAEPSPLRPVRRALGSAMFMPILNYTDGYGFTYGARVSFVDGLGKGARVSVPATWGGTKRVAAEFEKKIAGGPVDRVFATAMLSRRKNPHYGLDDDRRDLSFGGSRVIAGPLSVTARAGVSNVHFDVLEDRMPFVGAEVTVDTRTDPAFPRNAVFLSAGWDRTGFGALPPANRIRLDARGFLGVYGQSVLSLRGQFARSDRPLPSYERYLLGGAGTLRGYRTGAFSGDSFAAISAELRVPVSSPLSFARTGVALFADFGTAVDHGEKLRSAQWERGAGGGVFLLASLFRLNADVAVRRGGSVRLHVMSGFQF